jgi:hypothetical protein
MCRYLEDDNQFYEKRSVCKDAPVPILVYHSLQATLRVNTRGVASNTIDRLVDFPLAYLNYWVRVWALNV